MDKKKDIRSLTKEELRDFFVENGDKSFRGNQVYEWLWSKNAHPRKELSPRASTSFWRNGAPALF